MNRLDQKLEQLKLENRDVMNIIDWLMAEEKS
jgi:hypothetical protein